MRKSRVLQRFQTVYNTRIIDEHRKYKAKQPPCTPNNQVMGNATDFCVTPLYFWKPIMPLPIVLASTSVFRQQQLRTLGLNFIAAKPMFDETPLPNESAADTALRLAVGKAQSLANAYPQHLIMGADQVAWCNGAQLGKPMSVEKAAVMLRQLAGQRIEFYSAVCLFNTVSGSLKTHVDKTIVYMRELSDAQIERYLMREPDAIYCAGAAKSEGLGAALLQRIDSQDPNALIGLPIFWLVSSLQDFGVEVI